MSEEELQASFVARQPIVDDLLSLIEQQPATAGIQHVVVVGARGMGKTTTLLMVRSAVLRSQLNQKWQVVQFPEERYNICDLADFWFEVLENLSTTNKDEQFHNQIEEVKQGYAKSDDLHEAAYALIKDWNHQTKKQLLLLIDNFDLILEQINDEKDNARLRDALMNEGLVMVVGTANSFFREASSYNQPLYNFFKIINLEHFEVEHIVALFKRRATVNKRNDFDDILKANINRIRVLFNFTGGNPRLALMLYRVITQSNISDVVTGLERLLDEVTPYYKARIESLPPQQRKVLDLIAQVTARTNEGVTPTELAKATRMAPNQASVQLKRLLDGGYVQFANLRGRNSYYFLSERLYAIWYQMRFGRKARKRTKWLVDTLRALYDVGEMESRIDLLSNHFIQQLDAGKEPEARAVLDHRRYLIEAIAEMSGTLRLNSKFEDVIRDYLKLNETTAVNELLQDFTVAELSDQTFDALFAEKDIDTDRVRKLLWHRAASFHSAGDYEKAIADAKRILSFNSDHSNEFVGNFTLLFALEQLGRYEEVIPVATRTLELVPEFDFAIASRGRALCNLGRFEEALEEFEAALQSNDFLKSQYLAGKATALCGLGRFEEALANADLILAEEPNDWHAWLIRGSALASLARTNEAITCLQRAAKIQPEEFYPWFNLGKLLEREKKYKRSLKSLDRALTINPSSVEAWSLMASMQQAIGDHVKAVKSFDRALDLEPDDLYMWFNRAASLRHLDRFEDAVDSYDRAANLAEKQQLPDLERFLSICQILKTGIRAEQGEKHLARSEWIKAIRCYTDRDIGPSLDVITHVLFELIRHGHIIFVRQLVDEPEASPHLFPFARAIDYIHVRDQALLEKLSPEVRIVVEENIKEIRKLLRAMP